MKISPCRAYHIMPIRNYCNFRNEIRLRVLYRTVHGAVFFMLLLSSLTITIPTKHISESPEYSLFLFGFTLLRPNYNERLSLTLCAIINLWVAAFWITIEIWFRSYGNFNLTNQLFILSALGSVSISSIWWTKPCHSDFFATLCWHTHSRLMVLQKASWHNSWTKKQEYYFNQKSLKEIVNMICRKLIQLFSLSC